MLTFVKSTSGVCALCPCFRLYILLARYNLFFCEAITIFVRFLKFTENTHQLMSQYNLFNITMMISIGLVQLLILWENQLALHIDKYCNDHLAAIISWQLLLEIVVWMEHSSFLVTMVYYCKWLQGRQQCSTVITNYAVSYRQVTG